VIARGVRHPRYFWARPRRRRSWRRLGRGSFRWGPGGRLNPRTAGVRPVRWSHSVGTDLSNLRSDPLFMGPIECAQRDP
jgi:hypothetical protein